MELFSHAATVLPVSDIQNSIQFYTQKLSFQLNFTWGEPTSYAILKRGDISIHLTQTDNYLKPSPGPASIYIFVHDVRKVFQEFQKKEVPIISTLKQQEYGMEDFDITDPDDHILTFGRGN